VDLGNGGIGQIGRILRSRVRGGREEKGGVTDVKVESVEAHEG
jgi:hypothetical protein